MSAISRSYRCGAAPFERALQEFRSFGGEVIGGPSEGTLRTASPFGPIEGSYTFDGELLTVTILEPPMKQVLYPIWARLDQICGDPVAIA